jgi:hypothetical protein
MKPLAEINKEELIDGIKDINKADIFEQPIAIVGSTVETMLKEFKEAVEMMEEAKALGNLSDETINLYNNNDMNSPPYPWDAPVPPKKLVRTTAPAEAPVQTPSEAPKAPEAPAEAPAEAPKAKINDPEPPETIDKQTQAPAEEPKKRGRKPGWRKDTAQAPENTDNPPEQTTGASQEPAPKAPVIPITKNKPEQEKLPMDRGGIYKKDIYPILMSLRAGLSAKSTLEEMASFMFTGRDVVTFNDSILVVSPFATDFVATIKANDLLNVLKPLASDEFLKFTLVNDVLELQTESASFKFALVLNDSGKLLGSSGVKDVVNGIRSELAGGEWKPVPENFKDAAKLCAFSAAKKETLGTLTCLAIQDRAIFSCDNRRMSRYMLSENMPNFLIAASVIPTLINYSLMNYCLTDSWIGFMTADGLMVGIRRKNGNFPIKEVAEILIQKGQFTIDSDIDSLKKAIEEVGVFASAEDMNELIEVTIKGDMMYLKSKSDRGSAECSVEIASDIEGEVEKTFSINPSFWLDILSKAPTMKLDLENFKARFEAGKFCHVVALGVKQ